MFYSDMTVNYVRNEFYNTGPYLDGWNKKDIFFKLIIKMDAFNKLGKFVDKIKSHLDIDSPNPN